MFLGLAVATRYIGISLLLGGGIYWLTEAGKSFKERVRNALLFSLVGILPLLAWVIRNQLVTGRPTSRVIAWHPISKELWIKASNTILLWLAPGRFVHDKETLWLVVLSLALVVWLVMIMYRQRVGIAYFLISFYRSKPAFAIGMSLLSYWAILLVSRTYFDQAIPMDERLLSPVLVMGFVLLIWLFSTVWRRGYWLERTAIVAVILVLFITNLTRSAQTVHSYHQLGRGYASARDHISETYAYLRKHPTVPVYSNAAAAVYFWTDRVTYSIPARNDIPAMKEDMRKTGAFLVVFYSIPLELYGTTEAELTKGWSNKSS